MTDILKEIILMVIYITIGYMSRFIQENFKYIKL
jgi:hypothetical protein